MLVNQQKEILRKIFQKHFSKLHFFLASKNIFDTGLLTIIVLSLYIISKMFDDILYTGMYSLNSELDPDMEKMEKELGNINSNVHL